MNQSIDIDMKLKLQWGPQQNIPSTLFLNVSQWVFRSCSKWVYKSCLAASYDRCGGELNEADFLKVKNMQRQGTGAIRTQIQPSKPKREIIKITNSHNTKRTYGQPGEQPFPK